MKFPAESEPDGNVQALHHFYVGMALAFFGFVSIWPLYPVTGAGTVLIGTAILLDDVVSHVFGVPTPLDELWKQVIAPVIK